MVNRCVTVDTTDLNMYCIRMCVDQGTTGGRGGPGGGTHLGISVAVFSCAMDSMSGPKLTQKWLGTETNNQRDDDSVIVRAYCCARRGGLSCCKCPPLACVLPSYKHIHPTSLPLVRSTVGHSISKDHNKGYAFCLQPLAMVTFSPGLFVCAAVSQVGKAHTQAAKD